MSHDVLNLFWFLTNLLSTIHYLMGAKLRVFYIRTKKKRIKIQRKRLRFQIKVLSLHRMWLRV